MAAASTDEYFDLLPLDLDPQTKAVTTSSGASKALQAELRALNELHRSLLTLETSPQIPPPPIPVNPKRSANITKLKDSGNDLYRKGRHGDAVKMYHLGIQMALGRPLWEPQGLVREEVANLYANRAQAHMALQNWAEGAVDAEASVEAKRAGNAKAWWRRGKCLLEMGRLDEALDWVGRGLEMEGEEAELLALQQEVAARLDKIKKEEEARIGSEKA
ncbi:TPR-like protein [Apiospora arundinis]|uniref:TPR-like protein n=1 Tax=Apiospora arundinis TaxID=335852 RepID=A0ABR2IBY2_9PEZI